jgi:hypothetical protein
MNCNENDLRYALSYDKEVHELYFLLIKKNNSRTWFNKKFRLDESGLPKRLESLYNLLYDRLSNFGESVNRILRKPGLETWRFDNYCYFQILKNIYLNIKNKYKTNIFPIFSSIYYAIFKIYLFFLVKYFNIYINNFKELLEKTNKIKARSIKNISNIHNYNNITFRSIIETNSSGLLIKINDDRYKRCNQDYENFMKIYSETSDALLILYDQNYNFNSNDSTLKNIVKLRETIIKLHSLLGETITGRIERNKQRKIEREQLYAEQRKQRENQEKLPKPGPSWTNGLNQRELYSMGQISKEEYNRRQAEYLKNLAQKQQENSNKRTIDLCSNPQRYGVSQDDCKQAYARQRERIEKKAAAEKRFRNEYVRIHGREPESDPYQGR